MDDQTALPTDQPQERILLRKYRNRRYYDTTRSLHVTLEEIYELVRTGRDVQVIDSQTGEDITPRVLAQIILEQDPLKLDIFPVEFLHRVIRANEPLIREFMDRYFSQFLQAYLDSQRQLSEYVRQAMGLGPFPGGNAATGSARCSVPSAATGRLRRVWRPPAAAGRRHGPAPRRGGHGARRYWVAEVAGAVAPAGRRDGPARR